MEYEYLFHRCNFYYFMYNLSVMFNKDKKEREEALAKANARIIELEKQITDSNAQKQEEELTEEQAKELETLQKELDEKTQLIKDAEAKLETMKKELEGGSTPHRVVEATPEQVKKAEARIKEILKGNK